MKVESRGEMESRRVIARILGASVLSMGLLLGVAHPAGAAFSDAPDSTWMANKPVYSVVRAGAYVYIGGKFNQVRAIPPGSPGKSIKSIGIARLNAETGVADASWTHEVTRSDGAIASVRAIAVAGGKVWIGGKFDRVDGEPRLNLAAFSESTGELDPGVTARVGTGLSDEVRALLASGSTVYMGGKFATVDGVGRKRLAAFDLNGGLTNWRPRTGYTVRALTFDCEGDDVLAGGAFETAGGPSGALQTRKRIALFDASTGALEAWAVPPGDLPNGVAAFDLALSCAISPPRLYGAFGGSNHFYAFDFSSDNVGQLLFERQTSGDVQAVAVNDQGTAAASDDRVMFGGHFGGGVTYPSGTCSVAKPKTARFGVTDLSGNCDLSWWPNFEGKFWGVWDILVTDDGDRVWVGGDYKQVCSGHTSTCADQWMISRFTDV
jgi:hypothetical protein